MRIDGLISLIYTVGENSVSGQEYKDEVIHLSQSYGIQTPYTSYVEGPGGGSTEIEERPLQVFAPGLQLFAHPNPFGVQAKIGFRVPPGEGWQNVELRIYNLSGRLIKTLATGRFREGLHSLVWAPFDRSGRRLAPGQYLVSLNVGRLSWKVMVTVLM